MSYLLDTHVFLWTLFDPDQLSKKVRGVIEDPDNTVYVSAVTYREISLKYALGKLALTNVLPDGLPGISKQMDFETLDVDADTASTFYKLPGGLHRDHFDRLVVWQAINRSADSLQRTGGLPLTGVLGLGPFGGDAAQRYT